jgi:hypothetical protein
MAAPKVFISYSHDSDAHKAWVLKLAGDLRGLGIDVMLDHWDLVPGQDISLFMQKGISGADRVLLVCTDIYVNKAEHGTGGVGYERLIVTSEVVQSIDTIKFVPVIRDNTAMRVVPNFLGPRRYIDFRKSEEYEASLTELARDIHGAPAVTKPPLGPNPFSGIAILQAPAGSPPANAVSRAYQQILGTSWHAAERKKAENGISKLKLSSFMELQVGIHHSLVKSQIELLNAVRQSEVRTFGWPIGITLDGRDEYRPMPYGDGIKAEVSIGDGSTDDRVTYDYWAFRSNGDFFLLQSLFEDMKKPQHIFFDTRIVRVTESLMFSENIYTKLGAPPDSKISIRVSHHGFAGRSLIAASASRHLRPRLAKENNCVSEISTTLGAMGDTRVEDVKRLLEPLFMLFDFQQFDTKVYEDIVRNFEEGKIG